MSDLNTTMLFHQYNNFINTIVPYFKATLKFYYYSDKEMNENLPCNTILTCGMNSHLC